LLHALGHRKQKKIVEKLESFLSEEARLQRCIAEDFPPASGHDVVASATEIAHRYRQLQISEASRSLEDALGKLEACAGGVQGGASWKAALADDSTLDTVLEMAGRSLLKVGNEIAKAYESAKLVTGRYSKQCRDHCMKPDQHLSDRADKALRLAQVTVAECLLARKVADTTGPTQAEVEAMNKVLASIGKNGVAVDEIQPVIWSKARLISRGQSVSQSRAA
jgi:hypothetical protein